MKDPDRIDVIRYQVKYGPAAVRMWRDSKADALGIPEPHSFDSHLAFLNEALVRDSRVYLVVLRNSDKVVGLMATDCEYVNQLYVHREYQRLGIGSRLLERAKAESNGWLRLYTFEVNRGAQAFYDRHGFRVIGRGNDNEEGLPDILYEWRGSAFNAG